MQIIEDEWMDGIGSPGIKHLYGANEKSDRVPIITCVHTQSSRVHVTQLPEQGHMAQPQYLITFLNNGHSQILVAERWHC